MIDIQIKQLINKASLFPIHTTVDGQIIQNYALPLYLTAKNNHKYSAYCFSVVVYDTPNPEQEVQKLKQRNAKITLFKLVKAKLTGRQGLRGHKGYFAFQKTELMEEWLGDKI